VQGEGADVPADFGRLITPNNLDDELAAVRAGFESRARSGEREP
jgi:hypothetical protein